MATNRDYFYLREVLLGLRNEYIENQKKINELRKYLSIKDPYKKLNMYISSEGDDLYLVLNLERKQEILKSMLESLLLRRKFDKQANEVILSRSVNDKKNYVISNSLKNIDISDTNAFYCKADHILSSDFVQSTMPKYKKLDSEGLDFKYSPNGIYVFTGNSCRFAQNAGFDYKASADEFVIDPYYVDSLSDFAADQILETKIPMSLFSKYAFEKITNNPDREMRVEVVNFFSDEIEPQHFKFQKDEEENIMQLRRVK